MDDPLPLKGVSVTWIYEDNPSRRKRGWARPRYNYTKVSTIYQWLQTCPISFYVLNPEEGKVWAHCLWLNKGISISFPCCRNLASTRFSFTLEALSEGWSRNDDQGKSNSLNILNSVIGDRPYLQMEL